MHPIERLRAVARAGWAPPDVLGAEAAWALAELAMDEPHALLPACRRLLERHPACGPLWWVAARILCAGDAVAEAERCGDELDTDPTASRLEEALTDRGRVVRHGGVGEAAAADVVVVSSSMLGGAPGGMTIDPDDAGLLEAARCVEVPVWVEAGVGRVLPPRLWAAAERRLEGGRPRRVGIDAAGVVGGARAVERVSLDGVAMVAGPDGVRPLADAVSRATCPEPPELLAPW